MVMTRQSFLNTRDTIIQPNDPLDMDLVLIDYQGFPLNLRDGASVVALRFSLVSQIGGWWMSVVNSATPNYNPGMPCAITITDPDKGAVTITCEGQVLNMLDGYNYTIQKKMQADPDTAYKTVARGFIELFNR
jgi:hypothetical protein